MNERFDKMLFLAVLVTAIIMIYVGDANPMAVKVLADLVAAYWVVRSTRKPSQGPEEITR